MAVCKKCGKNLKSTNIILSVSSGSIAEQKGIVKGDSIVAIDGKPVRTKEEIDSAVNDKESCRVNISHKDEIKTITIENIPAFMNSLEFKDEETCSNCGAKQKRNSLPIIIGIILGILIIIFVILLFSKKQQQKSFDINIEKNDVEFTDKTIGSDSFSTLSNPNLVVNIHGTETQITASGELTGVEKSKNIEALDKKLESNNSIYVFPEFEDSDPIFTEKRVGSDTYRKMYAKNDKFDVRKPMVSDYTFGDLSQSELIDIGKTKNEVLGTVYFDYGYANNPKNGSVQTKKITLGKIDFTEIRYTETIYALRALLSEIPQSAINTTVFFVDGHTDHTSPHDFNQILSEARANCIKEILVKTFGISENNIITKGYSWDRLAINTMDECAENRRVEISVVYFN